MERISDRIRTIIEHKLDGKKRTQTLEAYTGIAGETWRKLLSGKQNGTLLMLEAVCKQWPEYAFWLTTGIPDEKLGHRQPKTDFSKHGQMAESPISSRLFNELIKISDDAATGKLATLDELKTLTELDMIVTDEERPRAPISKIEVLEKIRWVEIFLDNYIVELGIDDAISTYNMMRGITKGIERAASEIGEANVVNTILGKFIATKIQLEKKRDLIIEMKQERVI
ncbi:hypothetical protein [Massilia sp. CCM 8734]|uniref:hypothetical protein n=1 Tax=Massilia sp. CCM 8734 TaxID=2609283 RepID=UPI001422930C|nr:hypothetical protein [Massilia sp. CCM 8734]NHZ96525.1 hypothetical protein [Massilia sp. CCM 8734]